MKIVINRQYGGFSLSYAGVMLYAKLKGIKIYAWVKSDGDSNNLISYNPSKIENFIHYSTAPLKDGKIIDDTYFSSRDIKRNDIFLIRVIEKLKEKANGRYATLKIVEIPDGVKWCIEEYDGLETIEEEHRSWL